MITLNFLVLFHNVFVEILSGSVILPPESVGAVQPVSKSIELILLWRRWEPEPWQPSAQISVGRELAGDMHTPHTHTHTTHYTLAHTNKSIFLCVLPTRARPSPPWQIQMFIYWLCWLNRGLPLSHRDTKVCVTGLEILLKPGLASQLMINVVFVVFYLLLKWLLVLFWQQDVSLCFPFILSISATSLLQYALFYLISTTRSWNRNVLGGVISLNQYMTKIFRKTTTLILVL